MSRTHVGTRVGALSAAFVIALVAGTFGAEATNPPVVLAQEANGNPPATEALSGIDHSRQLSLTVHKRIGTEGQQGDGREIANPPGTPGVGAVYKLELIQPLNTSDDWEKARDMDDPYSVSSWRGEGKYEKTGTTGSDGTLRFGDLKMGLYRVSELKAPAGSGLIPGAPFLVYLPMVAPDHRTWLYDVHAYPKNSTVMITKEVKDENVQAGEDYTYILTSGVPAGDGDSPLTKYEVKDMLDKNLDAAHAKVEVKYGSKPDTATRLTEGVDYTLVKGPQELRVEFSEGGLSKLRSPNLVFTTITTKTTGFTDHVPNSATLITRNRDSHHDTEKKSEKVHSYWGTVNVNQTDGSDGDKLLPGATFELLQCTEHGGSWKKKPGTEPLRVQGQSTWTTDARGTVSIPGVHVTDFSNNMNKPTDYCLQETKAPDGYVASNGLIHFDLQRGDVYPDGSPKNAISTTVRVKDYTDENHLPNTGGVGFWAIVLAGLAIIGGGFYAARRTARQR